MSKARDLANAGTALTTVSATELGYVDGVTSAIQTQLDAKIAKTLTTTTGDIIYASGANTPARLGIGSTDQILKVTGGVPAWATPASASPASASARVATDEFTSSSTYTDMATAGPAVTITTGTKALVIISGYMKYGSSSSSSAGFASYAVSGATTIAASDTVAICSPFDGGFRFSAASRLTSLNAGSNTFTMKYRTENFNVYIKNREIIVIDLGS